jgi:hypothetical protein
MSEPCCNCRIKPRRTGDSYCRECRNAYNSRHARNRTREMRMLKKKLRAHVPASQRREFAETMRRLADIVEG